MEHIYVTGHRNPDTDSIVSAMAYAALRNALGDREYIAARLGPVNDETQLVLDRFGFEPPVLIQNICTQVRDLEYDTPPVLNTAVTVSYAWQMLQEDHSIPALPVVHDDGTLYGMVSPSEIAEHDMLTIHKSRLDPTPVFNLLGVLDGTILNEGGELVDEVAGEVVIALPQQQQTLLFHNPDSIVLCGHQPDMIRRALELNVSCLIVCQAQIDETLRRIPTRTCLISTPYDALRTARLIHQAISVRRICHTEHVISFHLDDYIDDVRETVLKTRHRSYPILDERELVVGTLSRYHLLRPRRKKVVLVDHNESRQSVPGLDQADILEIIDHHRLADIQTGNPIWFRNEPVGSTATIIAAMYQEHGLTPSRNLAGMMAAAIVSDTVLFQSPTCTSKDRRMAERMARLADISLDELGQALFSALVTEDRPARDLFFTDFKDFHMEGFNFGISQITCIDSAHLLERKDEFLSLMRQEMGHAHYDLMLMMLTDVLLGGTQLICVGDVEALSGVFNVQIKDNTCFLPGVLSRKKQIVPMLSTLWG